MDSKRLANAAAKTLQTYVTFQAVQLILDQLNETNPSQAIWLRQYAIEHPIRDDAEFLSGLTHERKDLVFRILTVRSEIADTVLEFLPELVRSNITQANIELRRVMLERLTQTSDISSDPDEAIAHPELDAQPERDSQE
ncbi:MAG: RbcX chaperonin protein [Oscillatoriales cyanobacterium]|nr:MAG: RbcX chaperonin protein [Oscillatoriales cyanobacterium]